MTAALAFTDASVVLGRRTVVSKMSLTIERGSLTALVGPNGAGKTSLLRAAARLLPLQQGLVQVFGKELSQWTRRDLARTVALVPQFPTFPPLFDVRALVALGRTPHLRLFASESARDAAVIERALVEADLAGVHERSLAQLSGGERQRVALGRALAQEPRVLLLDEPTSNLDLRYQASTLALARRMADESGLACLLVMHDLTLAAQFCDQVALLAGGELAARGSPGEVLGDAQLTVAFETALTTIAHPEAGTPVVVHSAKGRKEWRRRDW